MAGSRDDEEFDSSNCVAAEPQLGTDRLGMVTTGATVAIAVATVALSLVAESVYGHIKQDD